MTTTDRTATAPYGTPPPRGSRTLAISAVVVIVALIAVGMAIGLNIHNSSHKATTAAKPVATVPAPAPVTTAPAAVTTTAPAVTTTAPAVTTTAAPIATGPGGMTAATAATAAEKVYRQYRAIHDDVFRAGGKDAVRLKKVELGNQLGGDLVQAANVWQPQHLHQVGWTKIVSAAPYKVSLTSSRYVPPYVILKACLDTTTTGVVNAAGEKLTVTGDATTPTWVYQAVKYYPQYGGWLVDNDHMKLPTGGPC